MSCIEQALQRIRYSIPEIVLEKALPQPMFTPHTLMDRVRETIIRDRVIPDIDIVGGSLEYLPFVDGLRTDQLGQNQVAVFYKDRYLAGREITSVHAYYSTLGYQSNNMPGGRSGSTLPGATGDVTTQCNPCKTDMFCNPAQNQMIKSLKEKAMTSMIGLDDPVNTSVSLIAKNTILLRNAWQIYGGAFMVVLSNDPYLNNIPNRAWLAFGELCVLAAKSYIYNTTLISLGRTKLLEGVASDSLTQVIDSYSTAEAEYIEFLRTRWMKTAFMIDTNQMQPFVRSMFGVW